MLFKKKKIPSPFSVSAKASSRNSQGTLNCHWEMPTDAAHIGTTSPIFYVYPDDFPLTHTVTFATDASSPYTVYFRCENDFPSATWHNTRVKVLVGVQVFFY